MISALEKWQENCEFGASLGYRAQNCPRSLVRGSFGICFHSAFVENLECGRGLRTWFPLDGPEAPPKPVEVSEASCFPGLPSGGHVARVGSERHSCSSHEGANPSCHLPLILYSFIHHSFIRSLTHVLVPHREASSYQKKTHFSEQYTYLSSG